MIINCFWEHNGNDTLLYATNFAGAYARGESIDEAVAKMPAEVASYARWCGCKAPDEIKIVIAEEKASELNISDADSDAIFDCELAPLTKERYESLKILALKSAEDFFALYDSIPNKGVPFAPERKTFYGTAPRTAEEMYTHTKNVNAYYFSEIGVDADNDGDIYRCRKRGFELLEAKEGFLQNLAVDGSYGEQWSVAKMLRRFIWHDRIHGRAMYRMAVKHFGRENIKNPFFF
ncbi:MAG: hypothetical protein IKK83_04875 [Clostridia bacterium]|nr:hypothetical protein [Clostridia bacterium]